MSRHREEMEEKYSEFLLQELMKEKPLAQLDELDMRKIHSTLMSFFGETLTEQAVRRQLRRIIERINESTEED